MPDPKIIQFPLGLTENLQYHYTKVEIGSGNILTLNSAPFTLVTAPGAGFLLVPIFGVGINNFGTIAYATNTQLDVILQGINIQLLNMGGLINIAADKITSTPGGNNELTGGENKALMLKERIGDPTAGDGTLTIYLWYINLEL